MASVSIRELSRNTSSVVDDVTRTGRPALVTKRGTPVAAVIPLDAEELEELVLSKAPQVLEALAAADRDAAAGNTVSLDDALTQLDTE